LGYRVAFYRHKMLGRSVLITGANRGLGLEFVKQIIALPQPPEFLFVTCRSLSAADELKKLQSAAASKTKVEILELDVCNDAHIAKVASSVATVLGGKGGLNVLINNAGMYRGQEATDISVQTSKDLLDHFHANSVAPLILTKELLPLLKEAASHKTRATVVNITTRMASIALVTDGQSYQYRASKAALNMISKCMAVDLAKDGIVVVPIHPGWVRTDMGGPSGMIDPPESVASMLKVIMKAGAAESGHFVNYDGGDIPW